MFILTFYSLSKLIIKLIRQSLYQILMCILVIVKDCTEFSGYC